MQILFIDNYDSFTYMLVDYFKQLGLDVTVKRNNKITVDDIELLQPQAIIIGPGPNAPKESGIILQVINHFKFKIPILGICLGHQAIGEVFGAKLIRSPIPIHGKTSLVNHQSHSIFSNINSPFQAMRYHSLILQNNLSAQSELNIICQTEQNEIMGIAHKQLPIIGLQFHPESVLTTVGLKILQNWKNIYLK